MKKIIFLNSNIAWGGGEKWHFNMARALKEKGHEVSIIANDNSELIAKAEEINLRCHTLKLSNKSFLNPIKIYQFIKVLKLIDADYLFLNAPNDAKISGFWAKKAGIKKIIYRRGMPHPLKNHFLNRIAFKNIDIFIANSNEIYNSIIKFIPALVDKTKVIYNGVEPIETVPRKIEKPYIIGNLGRLVEQKGQKHLIKIAQILKGKGLQFQLRIAGKGPLQTELNDLIIKEELTNEVKLVGHVNSEQFLKELDLFAFTSYFEGSANALIESLQFSVPAIGFNISSNPEVIEDDYNGYLINPFDEEEFAKKIILALKSDELYSKFQTNALKTVKEKFNYQEKVDEVELLLNQ